MDDLPKGDRTLGMNTCTFHLMYVIIYNFANCKLCSEWVCALPEIVKKCRSWLWFFFISGLRNCQNGIISGHRNRLNCRFLAPEHSNYRSIKNIRSGSSAILFFFLLYFLNLLVPSSWWQSMLYSTYILIAWCGSKHIN